MQIGPICTINLFISNFLSLVRNCNLYNNVKIFGIEKNYVSLRFEKCGEIWLLATTIKNAKMLIRRSGGLIHINVFVFCVGSAFMWGFFIF